MTAWEIFVVFVATAGTPLGGIIVLAIEPIVSILLFGDTKGTDG